uniref:GT23 domain-containing protein n=1 Tax=Meloidogyne hapla TaxID=6305 RepID=A0A1I8B9G0_MELHA
MRNKLKELFDLLGNSVSHNAKDASLDSRNGLIRKQFGYILSKIDQLSDPCMDTHNKVLNNIAQHINYTLYKLQYPNDCNNRRILVCYARPFLPLSEYNDRNQQDKVVIISKRYEPLVPSELNVLIKHHTNPPAWFMGQIIKFVLRENQMTSVKLNKLESTFNIGNGTIAGIQVRRTDKTKEAPHQELEEYMKWIDFWYNSEENDIKKSKLNSTNQQTKKSNKRKLFIATDEPKIIVEEAENRWGSQYEFFHNNINVSYGTHFGDPHRNSEESLISILAEVRTLAKCGFVVCTFSSNVP